MTLKWINPEKLEKYTKILENLNETEKKNAHELVTEILKFLLDHVVDVEEVRNEIYEKINNLNNEQ